MDIDRNVFFREVTRRISSSLDMDEAMNALFDYFKAIFPIDGLTLHYTDSEGAIYSVSRSGELPGFIPQLSNQPSVSAMPVFFIDPARKRESEKIARSLNMFHGDVLIMNQPWPEYFKANMSDHLPDFGTIPSAMILHLGIKGEALGELGLLKNEDNIFTPEHARLLQEVKEPISIAMSNARRFQELLKLKNILADDYRSMRKEMENILGNQVIGAEFGLKQTMEMVQQVAPMNNPVLLLGETGTGKEVIANAIHLASPRRDKPMIRVQCGAIPDTLLDSELFGHEKGAFTGALSMKRGRFERANGGTIFLDEIGELTMDAQVKLLRVLQEQEFERLGGSQTIKVDVRVLAATHRNLRDMVDKGTFREDLWYRLNVFPITLPPLRSRKEDIPLLATYFISRKSREIGLVEQPHLARHALQELENYNWPGNVRELQNVVERALIISQGRPLVFPYLNGTRSAPPEDHPDAALGVELPVTSPADIKPLDDAIAEHIRQAMRVARGKVEGRKGAAELLSINPSTLRAKMRKLHIPHGREAEDY